MSEQTSYPSERLLQEWQFWREMVNDYVGILQRLTLDDKHEDQRWRELNEKLSTELIAYRQASDRLRSFERAYATVTFTCRDALHMRGFWQILVSGV